MWCVSVPACMCVLVMTVVFVHDVLHSSCIFLFFILLVQIVARTNLYILKAYTCIHYEYVYVRV